MIDTAKETICKYCGAPIVTIPGHRPREYCSATHRQLAFRARKVQQERTHLTIVDDSRQRIAALEQEVFERDARIAQLEQVVRDLHARLDLEERFRTDVQVRHFKTWLRKHSQPQDTDFANRFILDSRLPHHASRAMYEAQLRMHKYSEEDLYVFREAWKVMLFDQS